MNRKLRHCLGYLLLALLGLGLALLGPIPQPSPPVNPRQPAPARTATVPVTGKADYPPAPITLATAAAAQPGQPETKHPLSIATAMEPMPSRADIDQRLSAFADWAERYARETDSSRQAELISAGHPLAAARQSALYHLIKSDPSAALAAAISWELRQRLPHSIADLLEQRISGRGDLTVIFASPRPGTVPPVSDPVTRLVTVNRKQYEAFTYGGRLRQTRAVDTPVLGIAVGDRLAWSDQAYRVMEPAEAKAAQSAITQSAPCEVCGQRIEATHNIAALDVGGRTVLLCQPEEIQAWLTTPEGQLIWAAGGTGGTGTNSPVNPPTGTQGDKKFLFMRVRFADDASTYEPETDTQVRTDLNNTMNRYAEMSYGTFQGRYSFTPTMTLPKPRSGYMNGWSDVDGMTALLKDAKTAAAALLVNGTHPYSPANFDIFAVRWNGEPGGNFSWGGGGNAWIRWNGHEVLVHEWGHAIGLGHANSWNPDTDSPIAGGVHEEYGNPYDSMGSGGARDYNVAFKSQLNWLGPTNIFTVTSNGAYRIFVHDQPTLIPANQYGIRIRRISRENYGYWLEYRHFTVTGTDGVYWTNGLCVMRDLDGELLDMTPGSAKGKTDCTLTIGRTYDDVTAGIHFTPVRRGVATQPYMDVVVSLDDERVNHPPVAVIAASTNTVNRGSTVTLNAVAADPDGDALAYAWDFGDGTVSYYNSPTQTKSWSTAGKYLVRCVVSDMRGQIAGASLLMSVGPATSYYVRGHTLDASGNPLVNAQIRDGSGRLAFSDSDGSYLFGPVINGSYALLAYLNGRSIPAKFLNPIRVSSGAWGADFVGASNLGPGQGVLREFWININGLAVSALTSNPRYPNNRDGQQSVADAFEGPENWAENFGARYRGLFIAPQSGGYTFYIASDDSSELWLSRDADPARKVRIAHLSGWTDSRTWDTQASQKSALLQLVRGRHYYIEALHKEGTGGDHLAVGVDLPDGTSERPIPAHRLERFTANLPPATLVNVVASEAIAAEPNIPAVFTLTRTGDASLPLDVLFALSGSATYGNDYQPTGLRATIPAGQLSATVTIQPNDDAILEPTETVILTLVSGTNYSLGASASATATLMDNETTPPVLTISATDPTATKSTGDPAEFTITRIGDSQAQLVVPLQFSGSAVNGSDFITLSNSVSIPAGETSVILPIVPLPNGSLDQLLVLSVTLLNAEPYSVGTPSSASILIAESNPGLGLLREWWTDISGNNVSDLTNSAAYRGAPTGSNYLTDWVETPRDWANNYGQRVRGFFIPPVTGDYRFNLASDDASELWMSTNASPTYKSRIAYVDGYVNYHGWTAQASQRSAARRLVTGQRYYVEVLHKEGGGGDHLSVGVEMPNNIIERPVAATRFEPWSGKGTLLYVTATQPVATKAGQPGQFIVSRTGNNNATLSANISLTGTARNGIDYQTIPAKVQFAAGVSSVVVPVMAIPNGLVEGPKKVVLAIPASGSYDRGFSDSATVTIAADPPLASLSVNVPKTIESSQSPAVLLVTLNTSSFSPLEILYRTDGAATAGADYVALPGGVSLSAGAKQALISVTPLDDQLVEPRETVLVTLLPGAGYLVGGNSNAAATIIDDDAISQTNLAANVSRWKYHDQGVDLGEAWNETAHDDSTWPEGPAPLGYSPANELQPATLIDYGPDPTNRHITTYFRQSFTVENPAVFSDLWMSLRRDDGVIVYLNGTEVFRDNLANGPVDYLTLASTNLDYAQKLCWLMTRVSPTHLVSGTNWLAAEAHQALPSSPDLWFELELAAQTNTAGPLLTILRSGSGLVLRWPLSADNARLQSATDLGSPALWSPAPEPIAITNGEYRVDIDPLTYDRRWFRLNKD